MEFDCESIFSHLFLLLRYFFSLSIYISIRSLINLFIFLLIDIFIYFISLVPLGKFSELVSGFLREEMK